MVRKPLAGDVPIAQAIDPRVREADLYEPLADNKVRCYACSHRCTIMPGGRGVCQVRYNLGGKLYAPWGYVAALNCDPTEKKPFYHVYPGSHTLTFGMLGCDLHCPFCQNWDISQTLRDAYSGHPPQPITAKEMVEIARGYGAACVASSYNEPLITSEWAQEIFRVTQAAGFTNLYVSNGNATRAVLEYIRPHTSGYKIDLKTMRDKNYRKLGGQLEHILDGIRMVHEMGFWMEIVTLVIPGFNDSDDELRDAARFLVSLSPDIPWHVTAFHKDYKMRDPDNTSTATLLRAAEIGYNEGLRYVYAGNIPGRVGEYEDTRCPTCQTTLIERRGYTIRGYHLTREGTCRKCGTKIAGIWSDSDDPAHPTPHASSDVLCG
jgi:pyruvate formate lyase activating enzyme